MLSRSVSSCIADSISEGLNIYRPRNGKREPRQVYGKYASEAGHVAHVKLARICFDTALADQKTQSQSGLVQSPLLEGKKLLLLKTFGKPATSVLHFDQDAIAGSIGTQKHRGIG